MLRHLFHCIVAFALLLQVNPANCQGKVGVVLSGGGASGMAHVGVLKALEENNIPIDYITGTSIGALIGGLYASGYTPAEIEAMVVSKDFLDATNGLIKSEYGYFYKVPEKNSAMISWRFNLDSTFEANIPTSFVRSTPIDFGLMNLFSGPNTVSHGNFDSLFVPFRCIASNITERKQMVFKNGNLADAIRASMTYPFYLAPIEIDGKVMFDGGLYNNFPADVLCNDLHPDFVIASNVTATVDPPSEDNLLSQVKSMLIREPNFQISCAPGIIINSEVDDIATFEFEQNSIAIQRGYNSTMELMDSLQSAIQARRYASDMQAKRDEFMQSQPALTFESIEFDGLDKRYAKLFRQKVIKGNDKSFGIEQLTPQYLSLASDNKIKSIYPTAEFNPNTSLYQLKLKVKKEKDFTASFGGVISSKPISTGFFELDYSRLNSSQLSLNGNIYFGRFYTAVQTYLRWDVPFDIPFFIQAKFAINQYDFFNNQSTFIDAISPPYIITSEQFAEGSFGLPIAKKGKLTIGAAYAWHDFNYYQSNDFERGDTADITEFNGLTSFVKYQINSLNRKMYPSAGGKMELMVRNIMGRERTTPGSTSPGNDRYKKDHDWFIGQFSLEKYFFKKHNFRLGTSLDLVYSNQPIFQNYTATLLNAPAFQPIPESRTIFQEQYRAFSFGGLGLKAIYSIRDHLDFRAEAYLFQPYEELNSDKLGFTDLGKDLADRDFIGSFTTVYHTRIGPLAASINYYDDSETELSFLVHFGYILFNKNARE